ncbi:hypothetical protein [Paradesulfitobacterium aromaticivorans]
MQVSKTRVLGESASVGQIHPEPFASHAERTESAEFRHSKQRLKADGHQREIMEAALV